MSSQDRGLGPRPDHERLVRATEPKLQGLAPALLLPAENANVILAKVAVTLNRAGSGPGNPILSALGQRFQISVGTTEVLRGVWLYQDRSNIGNNLIGQAASGGPGIYTLDVVHGAGLIVAGSPAAGARRNFIRWQDSAGTQEREFWVKSKDADIVAVNGQNCLVTATLLAQEILIRQLDATKTWLDAVIDFFVSWGDEFLVLHRRANPDQEPGFLKAYGGAAFVSFFDTFLPKAPTTFPKVQDETIPASGTLNSTITTSGILGAIKSVKAGVWLQHTNVGDLTISLIAPDGTIVELSSGNGGTGDDYGTGSSLSQKTVFDDDAASSIVLGTAPFVGSFKPEVALSAFKEKSGLQVNGTWTLRIQNAGAIAGTLKAWHAEIKEAGTLPGAEGTGEEVNPVSQAVIRDQHTLQVENRAGLKRITVRFRSKQASANFADVAILVRVTTEAPGQCDPPFIEYCGEMLLKKGTALLANLPSIPSTPGVQVVDGVDGTLIDRDLLFVAVHSASVGGSPKLRVQKWKLIQSTADVSGAKLEQIGGNLDFLPLTRSAATPVKPAPYQAPKALTIAFDVLADRAALVALYSVEVLDGNLVSEPIMVPGPRARDIAFFPAGDLGGADACVYA